MFDKHEADSKKAMNEEQPGASQVGEHQQKARESLGQYEGVGLFRP